jgi:biotin carboxylase
VKKKILMLGIGEIGLNQIKWAKEAGFHVTVTDRAPDAHSFLLADDHIITDATDSQTIIAEILKRGPKAVPDAIFTGNDFGIVTSAVLANAFQISGCGIDAAIASIDKILMKKHWAQDNIQTPGFTLITKAGKQDEALDKITAPIVIKPSSASGSQGVMIIKNSTDIPAAIEEAEKYSGGAPLIVEELIDGIHIDANGIFWQGQFYPCGTARRYFTTPPASVPVRGHEPSCESDTIEQAIYELFEKAGRSLGINNSPVKADFIISNGKPFIIELSARFHGDLGLSHNSYYRTGTSPAKIYYHTLATGKVPENDLIELLQNERISGWSVISLKPGEINNLDEAIGLARQEVQVDNVFIDSRKGSNFKELKNNDDVNGFVWASGKDIPNIDKRLDAFHTRLQELVEYN